VLRTPNFSKYYSPSLDGAKQPGLLFFIPNGRSNLTEIELQRTKFILNAKWREKWCLVAVMNPRIFGFN